MHLLVCRLRPRLASGTLIRSGYVGEVMSTNTVASGTLWGGIVAPEHLYTLDSTSGTTILTVPFGHGVDGFCACLGGFRDLSAMLATLRSQVQRTDIGEVVPMTAPDQIAVAGTLFDRRTVTTINRLSASRVVRNKLNVRGDG